MIKKIWSCCPDGREFSSVGNHLIPYRGQVLDSGGKTPIMKTRSGGFLGEGCVEAGDSVRMVALDKTAKKRQSKGFLENFHYFFGF